MYYRNGIFDGEWICQLQVNRSKIIYKFYIHWIRSSDEDIVNQNSNHFSGAGTGNGGARLLDSSDGLPD